MRRAHEHVMVPVALYHWSGGLPAAMGNLPPSTIMLRRCETCPELDTVTLAGSWTVADLGRPPLEQAAP